MKILSVVGARPQFIKAAAVTRALAGDQHHVLIHTGQHYDYRMSRVFFEGLRLPAPDHNLDVGSGRHGEQTGRMLAGLEGVMLQERPDWVLIYGDTNSTLAGALAASKLQLRLAHVEAGLRSFNRTMPEEINRILADCVSEKLFCPTPASVANLRREGIERGVHLVGDVMFDVAMTAGAEADEKSSILERLGVTPGAYLLATIHRAGNTDEEERLRGIVRALTALQEPVVFPLHPRTEKSLARWGLDEALSAAPHVIPTEPLGYLDFVMLEKNARKILTDSGGVQKEACFYNVPCITLREETEWVETVESGWNVLVGSSTERILSAVAEPFEEPSRTCQGIELWDGRASERIVGLLQA